MLWTLLTLVLMGLSLAGGVALGRALERRYWTDLKALAVAGQRLWLKGLGEVFVLGHGEDLEGNPTVDIISDDWLNGKWPSEIDVQVLDQNTISIPFDHFVAQMKEESTYLKSAKI